MNADIRAGLLPQGACAVSKCADQRNSLGLKADLQSLSGSYPLETESPFEGVSTIAGGVWQASDYLEADSQDALLKLCFQAGTVDLPLHSHNHSDRVILVASGSATFEYRPGHSQRDVQSVEIELGDILVFSRRAIHTFKVPSADLTLISYHAPFIPLNDPRQYTVAE